jgi:hypothetical protein
MKEYTNSTKIQIKENIKILINNNELDEAEKIVNQYKKMVNNDMEIYSINATIEIMRWNLEEAEKIIRRGLNVDNKNIDLLYNLAYVFQLQNESEKSMQIYVNLFEEITSVETAEQLQNNIIILQKKLDYNENIFLHLREYEYDFISSLNRLNKDIVYNYIEYLINKYSDLKEFFFNVILNNLNIQNDMKNNLICVEICKVLLKFEYKEEIYSVYNAFIIKYVDKAYNCKNLNEFYDFIEDKEEKIKMIMYLLNEAIENKEYNIFNSLLNNLIEFYSYTELKYATKEFFIKRINV